MTTDQEKRPRGRPISTPDQRAAPTRPFSVRLTEPEIEELQRRGIPALRAWLARWRRSP
jgi:hypothetical protein